MPREKHACGCRARKVADSDSERPHLRRVGRSKHVNYNPSRKQREERRIVDKRRQVRELEQRACERSLASLDGVRMLGSSRIHTGLDTWTSCENWEVQNEHTGGPITTLSQQIATNISVEKLMSQARKA